jgi:hypothetical protein
MIDSKQANALAQKALAHLKDADFTVCDAWGAAHMICQAHEGVQLLDRIHALCHRIEGDIANGRYWDRQAGQATPEGDLASEWETILQDVTTA